MRIFHLLFLVLLLAPSLAAQNAVQSEPADLVVLQKTWHREFYFPGRSSNPIQVNEDHEAFVRAQKLAIRRNEERASQNPTVSESVPGPPPPPVPARPFPLYIYRAKVENTGTKTIKAISWEYVFIDPDTGELMGHHKTSSKVKINPGKSVELKATFTTKPTHIVNIDRMGEKLRDQYSERVIIHRIGYTDGSIWKRVPGK